MEERKIIKILSIVAIVQVILLIIVNFFSFSSSKERAIAKKLLKISKDEILSFELSDKFDKFKIVKEKDKWFVDVESHKLPADFSKVDDYLKLLESLNAGIVIYSGKDEESDKNFGFDADNVQNLVVKTKKKEFSILIGNPGTIRGTSLIKFQKENKIRQVNSLISVKSSSLYKDWADRRIIPSIVKIDNISSFEVKLKDLIINDEYVLKLDYDNKKKQTKFSLLNSTAELDELNAKALVNGFINIKADNFKLSGGIEGKQPIGNVKIVTQLKEVGDIMVDFYKADGDDIGNYIAKISGNNYLYLFHEQTLKDILKTKNDLIKKK